MAFGNVNVGSDKEVKNASSTVAGVVRLYEETGTNTDGALTQAAASEAFVTKENIKEVVVVDIPTKTSELENDSGFLDKNSIEEIGVISVEGGEVGQVLMKTEDGAEWTDISVGGTVSLDSIRVATAPTKTTYIAGDAFDPTGMVVEANYTNGTVILATVPVTGYAILPAGGLEDGTTAVTIQYTEGGITKTTTQTVTVVHRLVSIAVTTAPSKTTYEYQDTLNTTGMAVRATYSDGATATVSGWSCSPTALNTVGTQKITVTYTESGHTATTTFNVTVERQTISTLPSQSGTLTYTGSAQTPSWSNYSSTKLTLSVTAQTNAGSYSASFTPKDNYRWSDGTTTAKTAAWSIGKAAGSLSLSKTSIELNPNTLTSTFTVSRAGNGTITVKSSNTSIATVSLSGTTVTVSHVNKTTGNATITVSVAEGTNHKAPANATCSVACKFVSTTLNDNTWAIIGSVGQAGQGANYWAVGDCKAVSVSGTVGTLSVSGTYYVYILGFNHNGSTGIDFGTFKTAASGGTDVCLVDSGYNSYYTNGTKYFNMNHSSNTNSGGWKGCDLRYDVLGSTNTDNGDAGTTTATSPVSGTLMAALPADLRAVMRPMTIYTDNTGGGSDTASYVTTSVDYLPLLAEYEIFGTRSWANSAEQNYQKQYAYFSAGNSKVKYRHSATGSPAYWWERSPRYNSSGSFCGVDTGGGASNGGARNSRGLAPAFRV